MKSYTYNILGGGDVESREWPVISIDNYSGDFAAPGDSGSCVADAYSRIGGIITGGSGSHKRIDITYVTPIAFIMEILHNTPQFKQAHLNPSLT